jgi:PAS domain S-box-containing protein
VLHLRGCILLVLVGLSGAFSAADAPFWSAETAAGSPFIRTYSPKEYGASPYNWTLVSDPRGLLYIGNEGVVLEYDGSGFRKIMVSEEASVRALAVREDGRVFVGALGELGYLAGDEGGQMHFVSLRDQLPREHAVFTDIWKACATRRGVYFFLLDKIFRYAQDRFEVVEGDFAPMFGEAIGDEVFVHVRDRGIARLRDGGYDLLPGTEALVSRAGKVVLISDAKGRLLILTEHKGFHLLDLMALGAAAVATWPAPRPFPSPLSSLVNQAGIYSALLLKNRRLVIGTDTGGILVMGPDGEAVRAVNQAAGLPDSAVMGLLEDGRGTVWIAHFNSLARIDIDSPVKGLGVREGLVSAPEAVIRHEGRLYIGTSNGAFVFDPDANPGAGTQVVRPVKGLGTNAFAFFRRGPSLFVTAYDRIARIEGDRAVGVQTLPEIILSVGSSPRFPDHLFVGRINGLSLLRMPRASVKTGAEQIQFTRESDFTAFQYQVRRIEADGAGNLWLSTASHGLVRLVFGSEDPQNFRVERYGQAQGLPADAANRAFFWQNRLLAATVEGFYELVDQPEGRFVSADWLNCGLGSPLPRISMVQAEGASRLWVGSGEEIYRLENTRGEWIWDLSSWRVLSGELNAVYADDETGLVWIATDDGLFSYNEKISPVLTGPYQTLIRRVSLGRERFAGTYRAESSMRNALGNQSPVQIPSVSHRDNSAVFEYSLPLSDLRVANQYRFFLEGFGQEWSDWSEEGKAVFTNLTAGTYRFRVEARDVWGQISQPGEYRFVVLPPWHETVLARIAKVLLLLLLIGLALHLNTRRLRGARKRLEQIVAERTAEVSRQKEAIRQQAEALSRTNLELERLSIVARETDNAVFIMDGDGGILWVNDAFQRMYGEGAEAYLRKRGGTLLEFSNNPDIADAVRRCRASGQTVQYETLFNRVDGTVLWSQTTLTPIRDEAGRIVNLIAIDSDITRIKKAEIELLRQASELEAANEEARREREAALAANTAKGEFLARMSHEIRTPMNGVLGFTEMLLDSSLSDEQRSQLQLIYRSGESLVTLINDILDYSKIEAGQMVFELIDFDPEVTVFDVCDLINPRINPEEVELLCQIQDRVPAVVSGDAGRFRQVLVNLLGNAVKFTQAGEIEVSLGVDEETDDRILLHLTVRDTGIGIPREKLETIFDLFQQADGSTSRRFGGTGLGLAICRQIATAMGGRVWAEGAPGQGSTFHFTAWLNRGLARVGGESEEPGLTGRKILLVDDNVANLEIMTHILTRSGALVLSLSDPGAVVPLLLAEADRGEAVDLCVLDIQMPEKSGFELLKDIRRLDAPMKTMPVLAFSSSLKDRAKRFQDAGFNGFLPKPVRRRRFLSMVGHLLGGPGALDQEPGSGPIVTQHTLVEQGKRSVRILLVEDNPVNQALARYIFDKGGYHLTLAPSGEAALKLLTEKPGAVDLIFMDIQMPGMDGREATRRIRALGLEDMPIVAMTAESMAGDREACLAAGMNDYMAKPVKRAVIYEMVRKWVLSDLVG